MKLRGCRFLYFFSLCEEIAFVLILEHSSLRGVKQKKHEILAFKPLLQKIRLKKLTIRKILWITNIYAFNWKKRHAAEAYRNEGKLNYVHPPMVLLKIFERSIYGIATWISREKIKYTIPHEQNHMPWLVRNSKTVFSKLTGQISLSAVLIGNSTFLTKKHNSR